MENDSKDIIGTVESFYNLTDSQRDRFNLVDLAKDKIAEVFHKKLDRIRETSVIKQLVETELINRLSDKDSRVKTEHLIKILEILINKQIVDEGQVLNLVNASSKAPEINNNLSIGKLSGGETSAEDLQNAQVALQRLNQLLDSDIIKQLLEKSKPVDK